MSENIIFSLAALFMTFLGAFLIHLFLRLFQFTTNKKRCLLALLLYLIVCVFIYWPFLNPMTYFPAEISFAAKYQVMASIWWLTLGFLLNAGLNYFIWRGIALANGRRAIPKLLIGFFSSLIYFLSIIAIIHFVYARSITTYLAASGIIAVILGYSAQSTLGQLFSGLAINLSGNLHIGMVIKCNDILGEIVEMDWRSVKLSCGSHSYSIPNKVLTDTPVTIFDKLSTGYFTYFIYYIVPVCTRIDLVKQLIEKTLAEVCPSTFDCAIDDIVRESVKFKLRILVDSVTAGWKLRDKFLQIMYHRSVKSHFPIGYNEYSDLDISNHKNHSCPVHYLHPSKPDKDLIQQRVKDSPYFNDLADEEIQSLINNSVLQYFSAHEHIIKQDTKGDSMHLVIDGLCQSLETHDQNTSCIMRKFSSSDIFGLKAFLTDEPRRITVIAVTLSWTLEIQRPAIKQTLEAHPNKIKQFGELLLSREEQNQTTFKQLLARHQLTKTSMRAIFIRKITSLFS